MLVMTRCSLRTMLAAMALTATTVQAAAPAHVPIATIEAVQGTLVRWSVPGTKRCAMGARSWASLQETCFYPIDMLHPPGKVRVSRKGVGPAQLANILVIASSRGTQDIELGDIPQANPSPADLRRNRRDQALLAKVWARREGPARFTLPLGAPATPFPEGEGFGVKWIFNGKAESSEVHSGADYSLASGTPVGALADGTVTVAEDLFLAGNAVFIDHGNGLVGMYFHLSELKVQAGQEVKKGDVLGLVGATGRASGPHLHLGIRWHDARIDPSILLDDPAKIPALGQ